MTVHLRRPRGETSTASRLAPPHPPAWHAHAACRHADPDLFDWDEPNGDDQQREARWHRVTAAYCAACPVRTACLADGVQHDDWGIWGGVMLTRGQRWQPR